MCPADVFEEFMSRRPSKSNESPWFENREINKLTSNLLCVCPVIDHEFRHHIVKVAVDPRGDSRVDPQTTLTKL